MRVSTYLVVKEILTSWGIKFKEQKTEHYIEVGKNRLYLLSLDNSEKIKGGEFKEILMEEATEFTEDDYQQLSIRLARDKNSEDVTLLLTFNPIDQNHWCVRLISTALNDPDNYAVMQSTYKDNIKNLSKTFVDRLKSYEKTDLNFWRVYCKGEPGVLENKTYNNFSIEDSRKWPWPLLNKGIHCYGLDFGYNVPMALMEIFYAEGESYVRELFYRTGCTNNDLAVWMQYNKIDHVAEIYADSAEPDRIAELNTTRTLSSNIIGHEITTKVNRFNTHPARKEVKPGIDYVKSQKIHLCSQAVNTIKEIQNYRYKKTHDGVVLDEPVKIMDHAADAIRYGIFSLQVNLIKSIPENFSQGYSFSDRFKVDKFRL